MANIEDGNQTAQQSPFAALYSRDNNFDAIRLGLSLAVLFSHCYPLTGATLREPVSVFTKHQTTLGTVAVDFFFVISGFLVTSSFVRSSSIRDYVWRRILRIVPGYWAAALLTLLAVLVVRAAPSGTIEFRQLFVRLLDPGAFPCKWCLLSNPYPGQINEPMWTLQYETRCYAFVAAAGLLGCFAARRWLLGLFTLVSLAAIVSIDLGYWSVPRVSDAVVFFSAKLSHWPKLFPFFCFGSLLSVFAKERIRFSSRWAATCAVLLIVFARLGRGFVPTLVVFGSYLLLWFAAHPKIRLHRFAAKGDLSYGVYLYAFPIQQLIVHVLPGIAPLALALAATACTLPMAYWSWTFVESPALRLLKRGRLSTEVGSIPKPI